VRVLVVGAGGVGAAAASVAARRDFFERMVLADVDANRARAAADRTGDSRFAAVAVDASDPAAIALLAREERADAVLNAVDPRFNPAIFEAAFDAGCTYLDMAMTLSEPHRERPHEEAGVKLGDAQFAQAERWEERQRRARGGAADPALDRLQPRHLQVRARRRVH
jgi:saccharopine dehydrogenase (NAD+, L-lysine forming)